MTTQIGCAANIGYGYARRKDKTHRRQCKMSTSKKRPVKGLCGRCFLELVFFEPALQTVAPLTFSLIQLSPLPFVNKYLYTLYTYTMCGGYGVLGMRQINTCQSPIKGQFFVDDILLCCLFS
jgi:hypothetical protein